MSRQTPSERGAPASARDRDYRIILAAPQWTLNGVNVFNLNLARGLAARGLDARILLTEEETELVAPPEAAMRRPPEVSFEHLPVEWWASWGAHWGATLRYLEERAPCVYVPNYDYRHSCVCPRLSPRVSVVGVVHSDDPLHYEHVSRLGRYWDATVCVSARLGERTAALCPEIAERIETIPIGIAIPERRPPRERRADGPLRVIYHGVLKQHQKRVLDLPRVMAALEGRGIPVRLTIAGGGPDEQALRRACAAGIANGSIRFLGVVDHDRIPELLRENDVYLLTSEFEGMPNALLEAMANGCVPVVSDMESGIPELVSHGESGLLVPIGDVDAFADRLAELQRDGTLRERIAASAYRAVARGAFSSDDMIETYLRVFDRVTGDARSGAFSRTPGEIVPPPAEVEGVRVFAAGAPGVGWSLDHHEEGVGKFPSRQDARDFRRRSAPSPAPGAGRLNVVATAPFWTDNWSNVRCLELLRGLAGLGARVRLLLTEERTTHVRVSEPRLPLPEDLPVDHLEVGRREGWGGHWGATIRYLEKQAPCIYLPTHDWRHAGVAPRLSPEVVIVGTVSGDALHLEQAKRLGAFWNGAVATEHSALRSLELEAPELARRTWLIRPGLDIPEVVPPRRLEATAPLTILGFEPEASGYARLGDLDELERSLAERSVAYELTVVRSHPDHASTLESSSGGESRPLDRLGLLELFATSDVVVAAPPGGTLPADLRLAMGRGAILALVGSALPPPLADGRNALLVASGGEASRWGGDLASRLAALRSDPGARRELSSSAHATAWRMYRVADMARDWAAFLEELLVARPGALPGRAASSGYQRPSGELLPPPTQVDGIGVLPVDLAYHARGVGRFPSASDYRRFKGQLGRWQPLRSLLTRLRG